MFTKEEFEDFRNTILNLIQQDETLKDYFICRKSTYSWSKKNDWQVEIQISADWRTFRKLHPTHQIKKTTLVLSKINHFIQEGYNNKQFEFLNFQHQTSSYRFSFQLLTERAKSLLTT